MRLKFTHDNKLQKWYQEKCEKINCLLMFVWKNICNFVKRKQVELLGRMWTKSLGKFITGKVNVRMQGKRKGPSAARNAIALASVRLTGAS